MLFNNLLINYSMSPPTISQAESGISSIWCWDDNLTGWSHDRWSLLWLHSADGGDLLVHFPGNLKDLCVVKHALLIELDLPLIKKLIVGLPVDRREELIRLFKEDAIFTGLFSVPARSAFWALDGRPNSWVIMFIHFKVLMIKHWNKYDIYFSFLMKNHHLTKMKLAHKFAVGF